MENLITIDEKYRIYIEENKKGICGSTNAYEESIGKWIATPVLKDYTDKELEDMYRESWYYTIFISVIMGVFLGFIAVLIKDLISF
jgi:hypothetical protein